MPTLHLHFKEATPLAEPEGTVEPQTAPALPEAQSEPADAPQETPALTIDEVKALIAERDTEIRKELDAAYKTLRRGEAKSDTAQKRIERLENELFEVSTRGLEPQQREVETLKRQVARDTESRQMNPEAELTAFNAWASSYLEEEGIDAKDPTLTDAFRKFGEGWQSQADLRVALTRAAARAQGEKAKAARAESAEREKKAREDERAKLRNETRQKEGPLDKGTPSSTPKPKSFLEMSPEEWKTFNAERVKR